MCTHLKTLLKYMKQKLLVKIDVTQTPTLEPGEVVPLKWILQSSADCSP